MEQSFARLGATYIDLMQFHGVSSQENYDLVTAPEVRWRWPARRRPPGASATSGLHPTTSTMP